MDLKIAAGELKPLIFHTKIESFAGACRRLVVDKFRLELEAETFVVVFSLSSHIFKTFIKQRIERIEI